jgi:colicin import membrane protein
VNRREQRPGGSWASWSLSILLHLALVAIIAGWWFWTQRSRPPEPLGIQGSVVTAEELAARAAPPPDPVPEPVPVEPEPEPEPPPPEADPAVLQAEAERVAEERRIAEAQQAAERKAQEDEARAQAERARQEKERADKEKADKERAERERLAKERAERERREREQADRDRRETELAAQLEAEQRAAAVRDSAQARQYEALLASRVRRAWIKPLSLRPDLECLVTATVVLGGTVTDVRIGRCNGDEAVRQSMENAVRAASPFPPPPDPALFERERTFRFIPEG